MFLRNKRSDSRQEGRSRAKTREGGYKGGGWGWRGREVLKIVRKALGEVRISLEKLRVRA